MYSRIKLSNFNLYGEVIMKKLKSFLLVTLLLFAGLTFVPELHSQSSDPETCHDGECQLMILVL